MHSSTATNRGTKAPRTFVETMNYVPNTTARRIAEKKAASDLLVKAMDEHRCKKCSYYIIGCTPGQIILCTKLFLDDVEKGAMEA